MPMDWQAAFLKQARADFEIVELLQRQRSPVAACHLLHYLQMCLEKLAKGMEARPKLHSPPKKVHKGGARFLQLMAKKSRVSDPFHVKLERLGLSKSSGQSQAMINSLVPTAQALEQLAPALAGDGPNLEYPWLPPHAAEVSIPAKHNFITGALSQPNVIQLINLLRVLLSEDW